MGRIGRCGWARATATAARARSGHVRGRAGASGGIGISAVAATGRGCHGDIGATAATTTLAAIVAAADGFRGRDRRHCPEELRDQRLEGLGLHGVTSRRPVGVAVSTKRCSSGGRTEDVGNAAHAVVAQVGRFGADTDLVPVRGTRQTPADCRFLADKVVRLGVELLGARYDPFLGRPFVERPGQGQRTDQAVVLVVHSCLVRGQLDGPADQNPSRCRSGRNGYCFSQSWRNCRREGKNTHHDDCYTLDVHGTSPLSY